MKRLDRVDGLRLFGILVIIASHVSAFGLYGQGSVWANFFLVASGFFACAPLFPDGEERYTSVKGWGRYYLLRFVRLVLPVWFVLIFFYILRDPLLPDRRTLLKNMLFIDSSAHLWFIQHVLFASLFVPLLSLILYHVKRICRKKCGDSGKINRAIGLILIVITVFLSYVILYRTHLTLLWNGKGRKLFGVFFYIGFSLGYLIKGVDLDKLRCPAWLRIVLDFVSFALIMGLSFLSSAGFLTRISGTDVSYHIGWKKPLTVTLLCTLLMFVIVINQEGLIARLLSMPLLVRFGKCTLDIYLIHFFLIRFFNITPARNFVIVVFLTLPVSLFLTEEVENPIYKMVKRHIK